MKYAVIILSDPKSGTEEALARAYNGYSFAYDCKRHGDEVVIIFLGTGARCPIELEKEDHPVHKVYAKVKDKIFGVSSECAVVFGTNENIKQIGYAFLTDNDLPETSGVASIRNLVSEDFTVMTF